MRAKHKHVSIKEIVYGTITKQKERQRKVETEKNTTHIPSIKRRRGSSGPQLKIKPTNNSLENMTQK